MKRQIQKILIIRLSSLGDVLLASPLLRQLREKFPTAQIDFLTRPEYSDLFRYNPHLTRVLLFDTTHSFGYLWHWRARIGREGYDTILDIHNSLRSNILTRVPGFRTRIYRIRKNQWIRFLLVRFKINLYLKFHRRILPVWEKYMRTAFSLGVRDADGHLELFLSPESEKTAVEFFNHLPGAGWEIAVAPGARHFTKRWPEEFFSETITYLFREHGWRSLLLGSAAEVSTIENILARVPDGAAISVAGKFSILESAALIRRCRVLVSNDSGLMHVGNALGIPMVAIFGSTVRELGFYPERSAITILENAGLYCRPCSHIGRNECPEGHLRCLREIPPKLVVDAIREMSVIK